MYYTKKSEVDSANASGTQALTLHKKRFRNSVVAVEKAGQRYSGEEKKKPEKRILCLVT